MGVVLGLYWGYIGVILELYWGCTGSKKPRKGTAIWKQTATTQGTSFPNFGAADPLPALEGRHLKTCKTESYFSDGSSDDTTTPKLGFLIKVPMLPSLLQNEACPLRLIVTFGRQILSPCNEMTQAAVEGQTPALLHDPIYPYHRILGSLAGVCPSPVQNLLVLCR